MTENNLVRPTPFGIPRLRSHIAKKPGLGITTIPITKEHGSCSATTALSSYRRTLSSWVARSYKIANTVYNIAVDVQRLRRHTAGSPPVEILHLIETGGPGGAERMLLDLAGHLEPEYHSMIGLRKSGWLRSQVISAGIPFAMVNGDGLGDLGVISQLLQVVREHRIQLIHAHEFYMNAIGAMVSRLTGIPLVATVHGKGYYPEKRRRTALYRMVAAQAAGMVVVSQDLLQFFCQTTGVPGNQVQVIHNGIDTVPLSDTRREPKLREALGISPEAPIIGTLGNLYTVKGHVYLIRAAKIVLERRPDTHVMILGRGDLKDSLIAEAEALEIQDRVHLLGYRDDAHRWLETMDVFTLPSLSEGLPLSLLEAMAAGIPSVVTAVGGMPEVVCDGQTGLIVPPADPNALAGKILFLLENPPDAAKMGATGCSHVRKRFSLTRMVAEYCTLYHKILTSKRTVLASP